MNHITPKELRRSLAEGKTFFLLDVREPFEHNHFNIGGTLLPLAELMQRREELPSDQQIIVYCEKGIRSIIAIQRLEAAGFPDLLNLEGGMKAWREAE